jgi:hypothetical protein
MHFRQILPTVADLVSRAVADTDFLRALAAERDPDVLAAAADAADEAAEQWETEHGAIVGKSVPHMLIVDARHALAARGEAWMADRQADAADALRDSIEAGDRDRQGAPVGYAMHRSAA